MNEEMENLEFIINYVNNKLDEELKSFDELELNYRRFPDRYGIAYNLALNTLKILKNGIDKPYFARIDFKNGSDKQQNKIYIGKYGIMDENAKSLVVDWRAPISNLYYDSEIGQVSYESPSGEITGELLLKRQFEIENGMLNNFYDVDLVSNDNLLQKYLNENNDKRLKNIVSTIQKEQNIAIRKPLNKNIIVQGVAGSGKTTIALHRIAYLVYNYRNTIKNNQYLVIGPNDVFLKYIKSVLPDLDVDDVAQKTYEAFAKELIDENDFSINSSFKYLNKYLSGKVDNDIPKFKSSLKFKDMLDLFIDDYIEGICSNDLIIKDYKILDKKEIKSIFQVAIEDTGNLEKAIERFVLLGTTYIERHQDEIIKKFNEQSKIIFESFKGEKEQYIKDKFYVKEEINKCCKSTFRKYVSKCKVSPIKLYKKFINDIENYDLFDYEYIKELKTNILENIKNNSYDFEDLAPLMHIKYRLGIDNNFKNYMHVVVDEAQDLGEFNYYVLKNCLSNATFSIYGDIAQSIYDYRSIDAWEAVQKIFDNCELISFNKSYRTTDEIMSVANEVSMHLDIEPSELSVRHGNDVTFEKVQKDEIPLLIKEKIEKYKDEGYKTIAVISKNDLQSSYLNDDLSFEGMFISNIDDGVDVTNEKNNIATISNYLSKGLEFDVVIINNADEKNYNSNNKADMKMLYVALTRALHKLDVIYSDQITKPLSKFVKENNNTFDSKTKVYIKGKKI